ncbi:hypothetical protein I204_01919 [Kwoniella mangroviensis CBS 8886]|uniref:uncharacterized protein n=1 Tax=Kwoniella mangroviensis CBS 8507 TaxID=1296122 RepID=UPI00080CF754|nr:uncharacterized protein I203_03774 [Kwoniella mangroviensis CBS 8507]OCF67089.1 hypothetical protein I203_03774 [Kwoniella mangroviensis CBS 8507]OCF77916.1 hypothetical protein I204_01919 [Kwoniella mangroviensis CBS 8886]
MPTGVPRRPDPSPRRQTTGQPQFLGSGQSSMFLSPVQEARIDSWRKGASTATPPGPKSTKVKSAPASITSKGSICTCTCTCTQCGGGTVIECPTCGGSMISGSCSCSVHSPRSKSSHKSRRSTGKSGDRGNGPNAHVHGYYSSSSGKRQTSEKHNTRPEPPLPVSPKSPINFAVLKATDKLDLTETEKVRPHQVGVLPPVQWPPAPGQEIPMREMAKPAMEPPLPRIAGVRDPVSQNYYRNMFPPYAHGPTPMIPGIHPIGMVPARPWNT